MLNFATPDFTVDPTDPTRVDTNTCPLSDIFANSHIATKDTIEGVININQNAACKLANGGSNSSHDWCRDVESVFGDCVIILFNVFDSVKFIIVLKESCCHHHIHELWSLVDLSCRTILYEIFIRYLANACICKQIISIMVNVTVKFIPFF